MNDDIKPITGRVAQLLNARELVINVGALAGVKKGMKFRVLADTPLEVRDPESHDLLDTVDREKTRVEAVEVREKIAICRTYRVIVKEGFPRISIAAMMLQEREERPETLHMKDSSLPAPLPENDSYVKTNDRVVQFLADDK